MRKARLDYLLNPARSSGPDPSATGFHAGERPPPPLLRGDLVVAVYVFSIMDVALIFSPEGNMAESSEIFPSLLVHGLQPDSGLPEAGGVIGTDS